MIFISTGFLDRYVENPQFQDMLIYLSLFDHLRDFSQGLVDTRYIVYYVTLTIFFLFLTVRMVESRKWR